MSNLLINLNTTADQSEICLKNVFYKMFLFITVLPYCPLGLIGHVYYGTYPTIISFIDHWHASTFLVDLWILKLVHNMQHAVECHIKSKVSQ